jgi:uncharacterized protein YjiS (DUF1127 family)
MSTNHITLDVREGNSSLGIVGRMIEPTGLNLMDRFRRWRKYHAVAAEHQYSASEIAELGISKADIDYVARDASRY